MNKNRNNSFNAASVFTLMILCVMKSFSTIPALRTNDIHYDSVLENKIPSYHGQVLAGQVHGLLYFDMHHRFHDTFITDHFESHPAS